MFLRMFQHLLPDAAAWRLRVGRTIRSFFNGLAGAPSDAVAYVDGVYDDIDPDTTRWLEQYEAQFALLGNGTDLERRADLTGAWSATGGQSPRYLQDQLHAAGFTQLFVHDSWSSGPPTYVFRDPRSYTDLATTGTVQCGEPLAQCGEISAQVNGFLANWPFYLVNLNLTPIAPPPVPDDPDTWPYFAYVGTEVFGSIALVSAARRSELELLILRLFPAHAWVVLMAEYVDE